MHAANNRNNRVALVPLYSNNRSRITSFPGTTHVFVSDITPVRSPGKIGWSSRARR